MALTVNGETAPEAMLAAETESLLARFRQLTPEQREQFGFGEGSLEARAHEWARENVIERMLMRQEALRDSEPIPGEVLEKAEEAMYKRFGGREKFQESGMTSGMTAETIRAEAEATVKLDRLLGRITSRLKPPKNSDVAARYRHQKDRWKTGEQVRAAHIVKHVNEQVAEEEARVAIDAAKAELDAGAAFEEVADRVSDCPGNGGDLGWFGPGKMVEEFENVIFAMEPGQVSDVFRSVFGFHIAKLHEIRPPAVRPLSDVKGEIEQELRRELENKAVEEFVDKLREKAKIEDAVPA